MTMTSLMHERWPADRFYWADLEACGWTPKTVRPLPPGLLPALADELPVPTDTVHAVAAPMDGGRLLVCACPRERLGSLGANVCCLTPVSLPHGLPARVPPEALNLLVDEFEPATVRSARSARHAYLATTLLLCSLLASAGLLRRAQQARTSAAIAASQADTILADQTPDRREQSLAARVSAMRALAAAAHRGTPPRDAAPILQALLLSWPTRIGTKPQSLNVTADGISLSIAVEGDATPLLAALTPPPGFTLDEPRLASVANVTRVSLHMRRASASGGAR